MWGEMRADWEELVKWGKLKVVEINLIARGEGENLNLWWNQLWRVIVVNCSKLIYITIYIYL